MQNCERKLVTDAKVRRVYENIPCYSTKRKLGLSTSNTKIFLVSCKYRAEQTPNDAEFVVGLVGERSEQDSPRTYTCRARGGGVATLLGGHVSSCLLLSPHSYHKDVLVESSVSRLHYPPALTRHPLKFVCTLYMRRRVDRSSLYCCHSNPNHCKHH